MEDTARENEQPKEEEDELDDDASELTSDAPPKKKPRTTHDNLDDSLDTRCSRCQATGQACFHGTVGAQGMVPTGCAGCSSVNVLCSYDSNSSGDNHASNDSHPDDEQSTSNGPTSTLNLSEQRGRDWLGLIDVSVKTEFQAWLTRFVNAGHYDEGWKAAALIQYDLIASAGCAEVYFESNGIMTVNAIAST